MVDVPDVNQLMDGGGDIFLVTEVLADVVFDLRDFTGDEALEGVDVVFAELAGFPEVPDIALTNTSRSTGTCNVPGTGDFSVFTVELVVFTVTSEVAYFAETSADIRANTVVGAHDIRSGTSEGGFVTVLALEAFVTVTETVEQVADTLTGTSISFSCVHTVEISDLAVLSRITIQTHTESRVVVTVTGTFASTGLVVVNTSL